MLINKKSKIVNALVFALLVMTSICTIIFFLSINSKSISLWFEQSGNDYMVVGKKIGEPSLTGISTVSVEIFDLETKAVILQFETRIDTDGKSLSGDNYSILMGDDGISLKLYNESGLLTGTYTFCYEDLEEIMNAGQR